jgi:hypothetical protein
MDDTAATPTCPRCDHPVRVPPGTLERLRRGIGLKPTRITCGTTTYLGDCPCRSRFHVT